MANKWFHGVFLPSLLTRAGENNSMWLTQKQTAICTQNMDCSSIRTLSSTGDTYMRSLYTCKHEGYSVQLLYSKKTATGSITFSPPPPTAEEIKKHEQERKARFHERRLRIVNKRMSSLDDNALVAEMEKQNSIVKRLRAILADDDPDDPKYHQDMVSLYGDELQNEIEYLAIYQNEIKNRGIAK